jgi:hypothetical protein
MYQFIRIFHTTANFCFPKGFIWFASAFVAVSSFVPKSGDQVLLPSYIFDSRAF